MIKEMDYSHCPRCAGSFEKVPPNLLRCQKCHLHFYVNPKPTSSAILLNSCGEILFVIRKIDPKKGMLDLPGGFINMGETLEEGTVREIHEELGITVKEDELTYLGSSADEYEHGGVDSRTINAMYEAHLADDNLTITPADDVADFLFISPQKIPYNRIAFSGMKDFLLKRYDLRM